MLMFSRNKLVSVFQTDPGRLNLHGVLDDDIYGLELDLVIGLSDMEILSLKGKWNRHTTTECPRALPYLSEAVGLRVTDERFEHVVKKGIGRKGCRHFANLLIECAETAKQAVWKLEQEAACAEASAPEESREDASPEAESGPAAVSPSGPSPAEPDRDVPGTVIDIHMHTSPASPCSSVPVEDLIAEARRIGLDGICLTDHNYVWDPDRIDRLRQKHGFLVLAGNEVITDQGDMLVFGLAENIQGVIPLADLHEKVRAAGGYIIVAHPFRGFLTFGAGKLGLTAEGAAKRPLFRLVDAVEVLNGKVTRDENRFAGEVARRLGLPVTGGSDAHEVEEVGQYATRFFGPITGERDLLAALKEGRFAPVAFKDEMEQKISGKKGGV